MRRRSAITSVRVTAAAALIVTVWLVGPRVEAQATPAAPGAPAPAQSAPQPAKFEFASEAGLVLSPIKPDRTAAFEEVIAQVRGALARSADPVRKQQAAGWRVYRAAEPYQNATLYVSVMDPAVKGADYGIFRLLQESLGDAPARELFEKYRDAHVSGQHVLSLTSLTKPAS
jgi:hypothetical protein